MAPASENRSFKASEGRLYSAALKASLLIASPLLYLTFVAIIAFRDRVRMSAHMHQRVVALNLAPLRCGKFRFTKSSPHANAHNQRRQTSGLARGFGRPLLYRSNRQ